MDENSKTKGPEKIAAASNPLAQRSEYLIPTSDVAILNLAKSSEAHTVQIGEIKAHIESIRNESKTVIVGVLIASVLIFVSASIEIIIFHTHTNSEINQFQREYYQDAKTLRQNQTMTKEKVLEIEELKIKISDLSQRVEELEITTDKK